MQSVSQATEIVSYVTGTHRGRANQIARALIDAGILPKSSGRDIKKISANKVLPLLAAVAMADKVADAAGIAREFEALPFEGDADISEATLAEVFGAVMDKSKNWLSAKIELGKTAAGFTASIVGEVGDDNEGKPLRFSAHFWKDPSWGGFCKTSFTVSAEGVEVMRNLFARDDIEGMHFSLSTGIYE